MPRNLSLAASLSEAVLARGGQRRGDEVVFVCPAHDDEHPSANWNDAKQVWHCFACGAGGGAADLARRLRIEVVDTGGVGPAPRRQPSPSPATTLPSRTEVSALFRASQPTLEDADVAAYLRSRAIDPAEVDRRLSLARALPPDAKCPTWAYKSPSPGEPARPWTTGGYRLLIPLFSPGQWAPVSVRARRITPGEPKSIAGRGLTTRNLVMADSLGRHLLEKRRQPSDWPTAARLRVVIAEGEIDFLTLATWWPDEHPSPAVWGIVSGSWSPELAACVPSGALVELRTDPDPAGERFAEQINATLGARCEVVRVLPQDSQA